MCTLTLVGIYRRFFANAHEIIVQFSALEILLNFCNAFFNHFTFGASIALVLVLVWGALAHTHTTYALRVFRLFFNSRHFWIFVEYLFYTYVYIFWHWFLNCECCFSVRSLQVQLACCCFFCVGDTFAVCLSVSPKVS